MTTVGPLQQWPKKQKTSKTASESILERNAAKILAAPVLRQAVFWQISTFLAEWFSDMVEEKTVLEQVGKFEKCVHKYY